MVYGEIVTLLLGVISLVVTHYNIVQKENIDDYAIVGETRTRTYTECILKCDHEANCSFISIQNIGDGSFSCISLVEKVRILNLSNPDEFMTENQALTIKKIDDGITSLSQLNKTQPPCTPWSNFSHCDVTCGDGTMFRERTCLQKCPDGKGKEYVEEKDFQKCKNNPCVVLMSTVIEERKTQTLACMSPTQLNIVSAKYGMKSRFYCWLHDMLSTIGQLCNGESSCSVTPTNDLAGADPCPGTEKELYLTYECRPQQAVSFGIQIG